MSERDQLLHPVRENFAADVDPPHALPRDLAEQDRNDIGKAEAGVDDDAAAVSGTDNAGCCAFVELASDVAKQTRRSTARRRRSRTPRTRPGRTTLVHWAD